MTGVPKTQILIHEIPGQNPAAFDVEIQEGGSVSRHRVTMKNGSPVLVEAAFRFLLEREPKESILKSFDVSVISRYFPEFDGNAPKRA